MKQFIFSILAMGILSCSSSPYPHLDFYSWDREADCCQALGKRIAISSGGTFSSKAGMEIHELGGNAVDIAIATAFTLAVERPHSLGLGGGGFLMLNLTGKNPVKTFLDFRETAPLRARKEIYLDPSGKAHPDLTRYGILSVATPGFVPGLYWAHKRWGKLPWALLLKPAIRLAREGFPVYPSLAKAIRKESDRLFKQAYNKELFLRNDRLLDKGDILVQKDLAATLERVSSNPENDFSAGITATRIAEFVLAQGGILSATDLKNYRPKIRKPMTFRWNNSDFLLPPPPSAGGVLTIEMLQMLSQDRLSALQPIQRLHLLTEVMKRAYADRAQVIGDPDFNQLNLTPLLDEKNGAARRKLIDPDHANVVTELKPIESSKLRDRHTTHLSILDSEGNGVSMTLTINDHFGSRLAVPGTGIFLNDEMDDFSIQPGVPNLFGLVGSKANSIEPLKRPASNMTPILMLEKGKAVLAIGGAGGSRIPSHVFQVFNTLLENPEKGLRSALFNPRIHHQWQPDELSLEKGFDSGTLDALKKMGHTVNESDRSALVQAVFKNIKGDFEAVFDPRDEGGVEAK